MINTRSTTRHQGLNTWDSPSFAFSTEEAAGMRGETLHDLDVWNLHKHTSWNHCFVDTSTAEDNIDDTKRQMLL